VIEDHIAKIGPDRLEDRRIPCEERIVGRRPEVEGRREKHRMSAALQSPARAVNGLFNRGGDNALHDLRRRNAEAHEFVCHPIPFACPNRGTFSRGAEDRGRAAAAGKAVLCVIGETPNVHSASGEGRDKGGADAEAEGQESLPLGSVNDE
jgi:hypothetical protein